MIRGHDHERGTWEVSKGRECKNNYLYYNLKNKRLIFYKRNQQKEICG